MSQLKKQNVTKCLSLLREFVDEAAAGNPKKRIAALALDQLQRITAGEVSQELPGGNPPTPDLVGSCNDIPRIDYSPTPG